MKIWVLTRDPLDCVSDGVYFEAAWVQKPTEEQLDVLLEKHEWEYKGVACGLCVDGEVKTEVNLWYLVEVEQGQSSTSLFCW